MCLNKYSNQELLKEVAMNLYLSDDHGNISELRERELAALINTFYQDNEYEVKTNGEKRKSDLDTHGDNKKQRLLQKNLSALEMLPNEVYDKILKCLRSNTKKNLRITSKELYHKTNLLVPMFQKWCFDASRATPPHFVLETDKNFSVYVLKDKYAVDTAANLINRFAYRISKIRINSVGFLMNYLNYLKPAEYPHLTSLNLDRVHLDNDSLLMLAPQLHNLRLSDMKNIKFDISSVNEDSNCFTKLKTLKLRNIDIDVKKILTKCCNNLECLELSPFKLSYNLEYLVQELSTLEHLSFDLNNNNLQDPARNFLSKCSGSLRTLKLKLYSHCELDFLTLLEKTMKITTLEIQAFNPTQNNLEGFLNKCPLVQNLTLREYNKEINGVFLKDLKYLKLYDCGPECMASILEATKYSLTTVDIAERYKAFTEFPVISKLDKLLVYKSDILTEQAVDNVVKLFPSDVQVTTEKLENKTVFRRLYGLH